MWKFQSSDVPEIPCTETVILFPKGKTSQMRAEKTIKYYKIEKKIIEGIWTVNKTTYNLGNWNSEIKNYWGIKKKFPQSISHKTHFNMTHFHYVMITVKTNQPKFERKARIFFFSKENNEIFQLKVKVIFLKYFFS